MSVKFDTTKWKTKQQVGLIVPGNILNGEEWIKLAERDGLIAEDCGEYIKLHQAPKK
ncbi:hypothetical protein LCGC14_1428470 [marine sediment metagenome]|uniref:Uncharacterized protein n=1 Tax=marine sediment metagenome TaxID=412755 RepID=A0A0F9JPM1_9ZZZZ